MRGKLDAGMQLFMGLRITPADAGKQLQAAFEAASRGITPADAGKTKVPAKGQKGCGDHPRGCGENPVLHDFRAVGTGSPPRMRGKHVFLRGG